MKEDFWKVVDPTGEFPDGMYFEDRESALEFARECRDNGGENTYTRKVRMTQSDYEMIGEA